jgi:hypothetical protein
LTNYKCERSHWLHVRGDLIQSLNQKAAGRGENGDFRVPERNAPNVHEHRNAEKRHLQTGVATFGTGSQTKKKGKVTTFPFLSLISAQAALKPYRPTGIAKSGDIAITRGARPSSS